MESISVLASLGLLENSSVILVASMLISPLMVCNRESTRFWCSVCCFSFQGPILAIVFGLCIHDRSLWKAGLRSELLGLLTCVFCGLRKAKKTDWIFFFSTRRIFNWLRNIGLGNELGQFNIVSNTGNESTVLEKMKKKTS